MLLTFFDCCIAQSTIYDHITFATKADSNNSDICFGIVQLSTVNIRKSPNQKSELISQSILGMPVKVLKQKSQWLYIQTIDGYKGWTNRYSVKGMSQQTFIDYWNDTSKYIYTNYFGIIYKQPDKTSGVVGDIVMNNIVNVNQAKGDFYEIILPSGDTGYVEKSNMVSCKKWIAKLHYSPENLLKTAIRFLGFPYVWGGASVKGMDCSGFIQFIYFAQGIVLPRDAVLQARIGKTIYTTSNLSNLEVGDLLFFGKKLITHVAMYIGNNHYIHCSGKVSINSFNKSDINYNAYLYNKLAKVQRINMTSAPVIKDMSSIYQLIQ